jgi:molecular chaperone DnaK (HSP70)
VRTEKKQAVGLDFGTTTTMVATTDGLRPIGEGMKPWMPSLVGCGDGGAVVVGEQAMHLDDSQVVRSIKRSITEWRDFVRVDLPTGIRDVRADDWIVHVLEAAARRGAERGAAMNGEVALRLGCPAMWDGKQRRRLLAAAQRAGLSVTLDGLVDEPVAAGIAWLAANSTGRAGPQRVLVFDMGGGTLDIAVLDVRGVSRQDVSVLAAVGVAQAGDALDEAIAVDLDFALARAGIDVDSLPRPDNARESLLRAARVAKEALSDQDEWPVVLDPALFDTNEVWYGRDQLNEIFQPQLDRAEQYIAAALRIARLVEDVAGSAYEISRLPVDALVSSVEVVVLSGGMTRIPYVKQRMSELFPDAVVEPASAAPEDAVALGLAKAGQYGRINMYRPAFDVLVEWDRGQGFRTIYEAFTPLVEAWQIARGGSDLRYVRNGLDLSLPRSARGKVRVVSHAGERVRATLGGENLDGFAVALSEQNFEFSIFPNGRIRLIDASGQHEGRIEDWYARQGHDHGDRLRRIADQRQPEVPVPYPFNREPD